MRSRSRYSATARAVGERMREARRGVDPAQPVALAAASARTPARRRPPGRPRRRCRGGTPAASAPRSRPRRRRARRPRARARASPDRASVIAAASPLGPDPTTSASWLMRDAKHRPCRRAPMAHNVAMRHQSSITSLSWIPSEAVEGSQRLAFDAGMAHYDEPPPEVIEDLGGAARRRPLPLRERARGLGRGRRRGPHHRLRPRGRRADGQHHGQARPAGAHLRGGRAARHRPKPVEPARAGCSFTQTAGGRTGVPAPRPVRRRPFVQWQAPLVWTTLSLTIHADGKVKGAMTGASRFPRHWVYDDDGRAEPQVGPGGLQGLVPQVLRHATRRGATPTRRRSSPPSRPRSSARSRHRSCRAGRSRRSAR